MSAENQLAAGQGGPAGESWSVLLAPSLPMRLAMAFGYCAIIVYGSLVPLSFRALPFDEAVQRFRSLPDFDLSVVGRADWLANLFLYVPLGWLIISAVSSSRWHVAAQACAALVAFTLTAAVAVAVEFLQLWFPPRTVSANDLRAEFLGGLAGVLLLCAARVVRRPLASLWKRMLGRSTIANLGAVYVLGLTLYSLFPGDIVLSAAELREKAEQGRLCLTPFQDFNGTIGATFELGSHLVAYVPIGFWLCHILSGRRAHQASDSPVFLQAIGIGCLLAAAIEIMQLPIFSRHCSTTAVIAAGLGTAVGCGVYRARQFLGQRAVNLPSTVRHTIERRVWAGVAALYAGVVVMVFLAPFNRIRDPAEQLRRWAGFHAVPFAAMYNSSEFQALTNVLQKGALFAVLGMLLSQVLSAGSQQRLASLASSAGVMVAAIVFGFAIELAQVFMSPHEPDVTDVLIYSAGALAGVILWRWGRLGLQRRDLRSA